MNITIKQVLCPGGKEEKAEARWDSGFKPSLRSWYPHVSLFKSSRTVEGTFTRPNSLVLRLVPWNLHVWLFIARRRSKFREEPWSCPRDAEFSWSMTCLLSASDPRVPNQPHSHLLPGQVPAAVDIVAYPPGGGGSSETPQTWGFWPLPLCGGPHFEGWHPYPQAEPGSFHLTQLAEPLHLPLGLQVRAKETDLHGLRENMLILF